MTLSELPKEGIEHGPVQMSTDAHENLRKIITESEGQIVRLRIAGFG
jgi:hypothetical protein